MRILIGLGVTVAGIWGCGTPCRETAQLAEFELSQRNYERAIQYFEKAWREDSTGCPEVKERLEQARRYLNTRP